MDGPYFRGLLIFRGQAHKNSPKCMLKASRLDGSYVQGLLIFKGQAHKKVAQMHVVIMVL